MRLLIITSLLLLGHLCAGQISYSKYSEWEFSYDDQETWVDSFPQEKGEYWLRAPIEIEDLLDRSVIYGLGISLLASSEVYWDGVFLGRNGVVAADQASEKAGMIEKSFVLPFELLSNGKHEVKIRFSNHHIDNEMRYYGIVLVDLVNAIELPLIITAFIHIYAGCFLIIGLFYLVRYFFNLSQLTPLLFSILCLSFFALIIVEYIRAYYHYEYSWHFTRLKIILGITIAIALVMPLFFMKRLEGKFSWWIILVEMILIIILVGIRDRGYDLSTNFTMALGFAVSSVIIILAIIKGNKDGWLLLASVIPLPFALTLLRGHYDTVLYIGFGNLVLVNLISLANKERRNNEEKLRMQGQSNRLKLDLLKKNIQPHFINNSLTSAIDWIERSPERGVEFLFALSKEFDLLLDISEKKLIPIIKEIELCEAHLKIMTFRKEEPYTLEVRDVDQYDIIPPAIFLTILENGISYQRSEGGGVHFTLTSIKEKNSTTYLIHVNGESATVGSAVEEGTGTKYIKARLRESYGDKWDFESHAVDNGWLTTIKIS